MAPERTNTHRLNLDYISQLKQLWSTTRHAYDILNLSGTGVSYRRFSAAMSYNFVTHDEVMTIEHHWESWKGNFLADAKTVYFTLPESLVRKSDRAR